MTEPLLAGKSRQLILSAVKSLHPVLLKTWGNASAFREAATGVLLQALGSEKSNPNEVAALAEQIYQIVGQIRVLQLRHLQNVHQLTQAHKALEPTVAASPLRQASLLLAVQLQQTTINYLGSPEGERAYQALVAALEPQRMALSKRLLENEGLVLDQMESALMAIGATAVGKSEIPFHHAAQAGKLIEKARQLARLPPGHAESPADFGSNTPELRVVTALEEPVRRAELNEARARFTALNEYQKGARYDALRKLMLKHIDLIAPHAPEGFDKMCQAVEAIAYPYPAPLEWIRVFLKPLYTNAQQSSAFDKARTETSVQHRYQKLKTEKGVNPLMLELARSFALSNLKVAQSESIQQFINEIDLVSEFRWPSSLDELKQSLQKRAATQA
jgi:hypothetical protein